MILFSFRLLICLIFVILLYDGVESKGGRSGGGRGSSSSRGSSGSWGSSSRGSGSSWFGESSSRSSSSSSSGWKKSGSSSSGASSSYGSSRRGWGNRYYGGHVVVMRPHTYYRGGGYGTVYTSRGGTRVATQQPRKSDWPTVTTDMIRDTLFPAQVEDVSRNFLFPDQGRIPSKEIFIYEETDFPKKSDTESSPFDLAMKEGLLMAMKVQNQVRKIQGEDGLDFNSIEKLENEIERRRMDRVATIRDEKRPVRIGSISYFWGDSNLPRENTKTDCVEFSPSNDAGTFAVCNVTAMNRCKKSLADVLVVGERMKSISERAYDYKSSTVDVKIVVKTANEKTADEFVWFCPPSDKCCEWECCSTEEKEHEEYELPDEDFRSFVHFLIFVLFIILVMIIVCCCCACARIEEKKEAELAKELQQMQRLNERKPLTYDYLRQPARNPPCGNYGWSLTPSAPPHR